jgi:ferredoxin--NADP+ reductase
VLDREKVIYVLAVGPVPMMKAVSEMTRALKINTYVSLNAIMVDGTGMCGACRVTVGGETKFACFHGPDFDGHQVDFENLTKRQKMFAKQEKMAFDSMNV